MSLNYEGLLQAREKGILKKTLNQSEKIDPALLNEASKKGDLDILKALLKAGANIKLCVPSPLQVASEKGHFEVVQFLCKEVKKTFTEEMADRHLSLALQAAIKNGDGVIVRVLIRAKADVNNSNANYEKHTPLMLAVLHDQLDILKILIKAGADPSSLDVDGKTALELTSEKNNSEISDELRKAELAKEATHFLGIANKVHEGYKGKVGIAKFGARLNEYKDYSINFEKPFLDIKESFNTLGTQEFQYDLQSPLKERYDNNQLVIIPSGWLEHSISLAALKVGDQHFLIVSNRGEGMKGNDGCIIHKLKEPLKEEQIGTFLLKESQEIIEAEIKKITEPKPLHAFIHQGQKYGTCAIANKKTLIAGLLPFLQYTSTLKEGKVSDEGWKQWMQEHGSESKTEYKKFSYSLRKVVLDDLLQELKTSKSHPEQIITALSNFCEQHLDREKHTETSLLKHLIEGIPEQYKENFLKDLPYKSRKIMVGLSEDKPNFFLPLRSLSSSKQTPFLITPQQDNVTDENRTDNKLKKNFN